MQFLTLFSVALYLATTKAIPRPPPPATSCSELSNFCHSQVIVVNPRKGEINCTGCNYDIDSFKLITGDSLCPSSISPTVVDEKCLGLLSSATPFQCNDRRCILASQRFGRPI